MKIGILGVPTDASGVDYVREAERLGADSVWVPEFWGYDALTPLGALATVTDKIKLGTGIVQIGARTPAVLAMSANSLQSLSDGRFVLGLGTSGPQVMEGWHGVKFDRPIQRTRETIEIIRLAMSGERLEYSGKMHQLPLPDSEGRALRSAAPPGDVPIYLASLGPANLRLTGELADGWIGNSFLCGSANVFFDEIRAGAESVGRSLGEIDLGVTVGCEITDDVEGAGRRHAAGFAFTIGAMGSGKTNFYNNAFSRQGFGSQIGEVQRLWSDGDREAAGEAVPIEIGLGANLIGPPDEVRRRLMEYRDCGVNTLRVNPVGDTMQDKLNVLGQVLDIAGDLSS